MRWFDWNSESNSELWKKNKRGLWALCRQRILLPTVKFGHYLCGAPDCYRQSFLRYKWNGKIKLILPRVIRFIHSSCLIRFREQSFFVYPGCWEKAVTENETFGDVFKYDHIFLFCKLSQKSVNQSLKLFHCFVFFSDNPKSVTRLLSNVSELTFFITSGSYLATVLYLGKHCLSAESPRSNVFSLTHGFSFTAL